jgi:hypothetical protein
VTNVVDYRSGYGSVYPPGKNLDVRQKADKGISGCQSHVICEPQAAQVCSFSPLTGFESPVTL